MYLGKEFLVHMVSLWLSFWGIDGMFPKMSLPFYNPTSMYESSDLFTYVSPLVIACLFVLSTPLGVKLHLIVILICVSLMTEDVEHFACACWPFVALFLFVLIVFRSFTCFLDGLLLFFSVDLEEFLIYSGY